MTGALPASARREVPPGAWVPLHRLATRARGTIDRFIEIEASSGLLLVAVTAIALAWANSPWRDGYAALKAMPLGVRLGSASFERPLEWVVNDVLMVVFFFLVGLEIRRETHEGVLSEWRRAALPLIAALGGMAVPALIYLAIAGDAPTHAGWGVPTATDIAFSVGILSLLGPRVPPALRILLLALAVIDDLGAIIVIAVFYSGGVEWSGFALAAPGLVAILAMQRAGVRSSLAYVPPTVVAWAGTYAAGIHPTIAGVVVGLLTPVRAWLDPSDLRRAALRALGLLRTPGFPAAPRDLAAPVRDLLHASVEVRSPVARHVETLHPWVAYGAMPVFALVNAGVGIDPGAFVDDASRVVAGAGVGLVVGKPVGIILACVLATRLGVARLPEGIGMRHLAVLGTVAGIGFTMALFVAQLAFTDARLLAGAKLGVFGGSVVAALVGLGCGWVLLAPARARAAVATAVAEDGSARA